jgi:two-component system, cell cycle response regulator DivK
VAKRVLVVEDNELNLKLFCDLLRAHQFEAEPVRDGREAVARARDFDPQLVVMDIQMPHVTGLELIQHMKLDPRLRAIPIMAVTAYAGREDEERIRAAGANAYVSKPISLVRFMEEVRALMPAESATQTPAAATEEAPQPKGPGLLF